MKKEIAERWVEALRSGEYKQGRGQLVREPRAGDERPPEFCCLGVLCELAAQVGIVERNNDGGYRVGPRDYFAGLPPEVQQWSGMKTDSGRFRADDNEAKTLVGVVWGALEPNLASLVDLNDGKNFNFEQIAHVIEKYQEKL